MGKKHGTDGILCRQVPIPGYRARVFVWVPLKCYIHIGARAKASNPGTKSGHGHIHFISHFPNWSPAGGLSFFPEDFTLFKKSVEENFS